MVWNKIGTLQTLHIYNNKRITLTSSSRPICYSSNKHSSNLMTNKVSCRLSSSNNSSSCSHSNCISKCRCNSSNSRYNLYPNSKYNYLILNLISNLDMELCKALSLTLSYQEWTKSSKILDHQEVRLKREMWDPITITVWAELILQNPKVSWDLFPHMEIHVGHRVLSPWVAQCSLVLYSLICNSSFIKWTYKEMIKNNNRNFYSSNNSINKCKCFKSISNYYNSSNSLSLCLWIWQMSRWMSCSTLSTWCSIITSSS